MDNSPKIDDVMQSPPGGWRYEQPETGVVVQAMSLQELEAKVKIHRKSNDLATGDPVADIHAWICAKYPDRCKRPPVVEKTSFGLGDVVAFLKAAAEATKKGGTAFVTPEEAERRAAVCIQCPLNKHIPGCYGCKSIADFVFQTIGSRRSKWQGSLFQCGVCGCSNEAKVWLDKSIIQQTQAKDYVFPEWCWLSSTP